MSKVVSLEEKIRWIIKDLLAYDPEKIILFGSMARGDFNHYSDFDIVVIKKTDTPFLKRLIEVVDLVREELFPIDIFVYTPREFEQMREEENPFIEKVLESGRVIYEKTKGNC